MPSTAVNSYFWHFAFVVPSPVCVWVCVRILPRVGTNKVKSQSDKHICYIYYILNLCVCVSARTKNWAKYWQSQNNWNFLACGKCWTERGREREKKRCTVEQMDRQTKWPEPAELTVHLGSSCVCGCSAAADSTSCSRLGTVSSTRSRTTFDLFQFCSQTICAECFCCFFGFSISSSLSSQSLSLCHSQSLSLLNEIKN